MLLLKYYLFRLKSWLLPRAYPHMQVPATVPPGGAMKIRPATEQDLWLLKDLCIGVIQSVYPKVFSQAHADYCVSFAHDMKPWFYHLYQCYFTVMEVDGFIAGYSHIDKSGKGKCVIYVHKDYQGRGIGSLLAADREDYARKAGLERIYANGMVTSMAMLERLGYKAIGHAEEGNGEIRFPMTLMEKVIEAPGVSKTNLSEDTRNEK